MSSLAGKLGIVFGVANKRSIAWAIAQPDAVDVSEIVIRPTASPY